MATLFLSIKIVCMSKKNDTQENEMPFLDHLEEMRWRLIKSFIAVLALTIVSFYFSGQILDLLLYTVKNLRYDIHLQVLKVQSVFIIKLEIALIFGIVLALPVIFYQLYAFVAPGLLSTEKKYVWPMVIFATLSFLAGATFAYLVIVPLALDFFLSLAPTSVTNNIALDFFFGFVARLVLVFGVVFELPVVSLFLTKIGLLSPQFLKKYRRHAIVIIFIAAAILTPPDPTAQIMLAIPLLILYEATIWISYFFYNKKK